jgi:hypothetical protein
MNTLSISAKPRVGKLIWVEKGTNRVVFIKHGQFALLRFHENIIKGDPQYRNGEFRITY